MTKKTENNMKYYFLTMLSCLMLCSVLMINGIAIAYTPSGGWPQGQPYFTLHAALDQYPYYYTGGYHDVMYAVQEQLAEIGIELELHILDSGTLWDVTMEEGQWDNPGAPPDGWDVTPLGWWLDPTGTKWLISFILSENIPPYGYNNMHWNNTKADTLANAGLNTPQTDVYRRNWWAFQDVWMHDPPSANMFFATGYYAHNINLVGFDPVVAFYDLTQYYFTDGKSTLVTGRISDMWNCNPVLLTTTSQDYVNTPCFDGLMIFGREPLEPGEYPDPSGWQNLPQLAADYPTYSEDGKTAVIPLREDAYFSDGVQVNASDVKCTYDAIIDPETGSWGWGDFAPIIDSVEITGEFEVTFHLKGPYHDFEDALNNHWGGLIVPWHIMKDIPHSEWATHITNHDPTTLPGSGPYMVKEWVKDDHVTLVRNPYYTRYMRCDEMDKPIDTIIHKIIPDPETFKLAVQTLEVDLGYAFTAPAEWYEQLEAAGTHYVFQFPLPYGNHLSFNLDNPILSNRYVRIAISHAIPYATIINDILPTWGLGGQPGTSVVPPDQLFDLYNPNLKPREFDLTKAQQYLDLWMYSQPEYAPEGSPEVELGPVGDADFSGVVDIDDLWTLIENYGKSPEYWPLVPGRNVDPDFDNNEAVNMDDLQTWIDNYGAEYPFPGSGFSTEVKR